MSHFDFLIIVIFYSKFNKSYWLFIYYNIFNTTQTPISSLNVNIHSLCSWSNIINVLNNEKIIPSKDIDNLKKFLNDPEKWREFNE